MMFDDEFKTLPEDIQTALRARLEFVVRQIAGRYNQSIRDYTGNTKNFTGEQLSGMVYSILDLARNLQPKDDVK